MTNAELAIISLLAEAPGHGYEIEQTIEQRGMREWTEIGFSSIYYILKKLEAKGWVQSEREDSVGQGPGKKVYHLTGHGRKIWHDTSLEMLRTPQKTFRPLDLGLANLPGLPMDESLAALKEYRSSLKEWISHIQARASLEFNQVEHVQIMFDLALSHYQAELNWLDRTLIRLERKGRS